MFYFDGIIVVEGKTDVAFLSSFITSEYVITKGYELPRDEIDYLKLVAKKKQVIIMTDPDEAGQVIRSRLEIPGSINIFVEKKFRKKEHKRGIAECEKEEIVRVLKSYLSKKPLENKNITVSFLNSLGLNNKNFRTIFGKKVSVGIVNMKKLEQRLNTLEYSLEDVQKIAGEIYDSK